VKRNGVSDGRPGAGRGENSVPADTKAPPGKGKAEGMTNFIKEIIDEDIRAQRVKGRIATRFPPEPNGYLHIGHAKSICLNFGLAADYGGTCNLRFDDTNPSAEDVEYVESIISDVRWLGFDWGERLYYASDYFEQLYRYAEDLIRAGKAYVCSLSEKEISRYRGDFYTPGAESPYRGRTVEENLDLFRRMRAGEFEPGTHVLRAKIDMNSPNMNMRDPIMYRIMKVPHHRTGTKWCIYPLYDYAHPVSDAIEGITHSICTLEFEDHRPLYEWFIENLEVPSRPRQIEFARLNLSHTVMSKRLLAQLVEEGYVSGWDDPRMPTLAGMRRRGFTPESIRDFCDRIGVAKRDSIVDSALLEHCLRDDLEQKAPRVMAVLRPLRVVIDNFPEGEVEEFDAPYYPERPDVMGTRKVPFSRVIYIEKDDFREHPPKKWFRLSPGAEIRLRYACLIRCTDVVKNGDGEIEEIHCTWDPASRGGNSPDGRKVKGTSHWVSAAHALPAEVRLYDRLFLKENPLEDKDADFRAWINPHSLETLTSCRVEPSLAEARPGSRFQFERLGYFCVDYDSRPGALVFNRIVPLRDTWAKIESALAQGRDKAR
jgi:glutaminyl-tRNA synthetase